MAGLMVDKLKAAHSGNPDALFSVFTTSGHMLQGKIAIIAETVQLVAGKEVAEVPLDSVEAFSYRRE
jgi:hypothetical protein